MCKIVNDIYVYVPTGRAFRVIGTDDGDTMTLIEWYDDGGQLWFRHADLWERSYNIRGEYFHSITGAHELVTELRDRGAGLEVLLDRSAEGLENIWWPFDTMRIFLRKKGFSYGAL
jgi:hypothetical protein